MANKIPQIISGPAQSGRRAVASDAGGGAGLQALGRATKEISDISFQLFGQEMESRVSGDIGRASQELNSLQLEIEKEPDHNKRNAIYADKSQKIIKGIRDGLQYPKYQGKFDERIAGTLEQGRIFVAQGVRKQQINSAIVNSKIFIKDRVDSAKKSDDPIKIENFLSEARTEVGRMESGGLIDAVTAYEIKLGIDGEILKHNRELRRFALREWADSATYGSDISEFVKEVETALQGGTVTGFEAARLMKTAKGNIARGTKVTSTRATANEIIRGKWMVDRSSKSDMDALDLVHLRHSNHAFQFDDNGNEIPENLRPKLGDPLSVQLDAHILDRYGVLPNVVKSRMQAGLNAGRYSPERAVAAARHYAGLSSKYPHIVNDNFSNKLGLIAKGIKTRSAGIDVKSSDAMKNAVEEVYKIIDMAPKEIEHRDHLWKAEIKDNDYFSRKSIAERFADVSWWVWRFNDGDWKDVPGEMVGEYEELARQNFMLTKDFDVSIERAKEQVTSVWSLSVFAPPGQANLMFGSPEQSWGLPSSESYEALRNDLSRLPVVLPDEDGNLVRFPGISIPEYPYNLIPAGIGIDPTESMRFFWEDSPEPQEMDTEGLRSISDFHLVKAPLESDLHPQYAKPQYYIYVDELGGFMEDKNGIEILWSPDIAYLQKHAQLKSERDEEESMARARRPFEMSILASIDPTKPQWTKMPPPMRGR